MTRKNQRLKDRYDMWKWRLKKCGYSITKFCSETGISYNTMTQYYNSNPTDRLTETISEHVSEIERKCGLRG